MQYLGPNPEAAAGSPAKTHEPASAVGVGADSSDPTSAVAAHPTVLAGWDLRALLLFC